jgi:acetyltransferase-like isoleucine patch superfamily enzyme
MANQVLRSIKYFLKQFIVYILSPFVQEIINHQTRFYGDPKRVRIAPTANMVNTLFNTSSGCIEIGDYTFSGHNVSIITGTHNYESLLIERMLDAPSSSRDVIIGKGVWIGSNALILGPCKIDDHAVIAAGAVVIPGTHVPSGSIVGGVPAKHIKTIPIIE